jgi:Protein of unknown function (DUF2281)
MVKLNHIQSAPSHHEYDPAKRTLRDSPRRGYANESIVQELEKIPEPMQLSVLAFIRSLDGSATPENHHPSELPPRTLGLNRGAMKMSDDFDEPRPGKFGLGEE